MNNKISNEIDNVVNELRKIASATAEDNLKAEEVFTNRLLGGYISPSKSPAEAGAEFAAGVLGVLKQADANSTVSMAQQMANSGEQMDPESKPLRGTILDPTQLSKGNPKPELTQLVESIVRKILAESNSPVQVSVPTTVTEETQKAAEYVLESLIYKYASGLDQITDEDFSWFYEKAALAEDVLEYTYGSDNYSPADIEKVASAFIEEEIEKTAEYINALNTAEVYQTINSISFLEKAAEVLDYAAGFGNYDHEDVLILATEFYKQAVAEDHEDEAVNDLTDTYNAILISENLPLEKTASIDDQIQEITDIKRLLDE